MSKMEWKEFILIIFGGLVIITFLFTAQGMFMISKLESVNITFEIEPQTRTLISDIQNNSINYDCSNEKLNLYNIYLEKGYLQREDLALYK